jgi:hypothetical protein
MGSALRSAYAVQVRPWRDRWEVRFRVDHQAFTLGPVSRKDRAAFFAKCLRAALDRLALQGGKRVKW